MPKATTADEAAGEAAQLNHAVEALRRDRPELSAGMPMWLWQKATIAGLCGVSVLGAMLAPRATVTAALAVLALPFLCVVCLRAVALVELARQRSDARPAPRVADDDLPRYTVLVPLFREAEVVPGLVRALLAVDYPPDRLDILLIVESVDHETPAAIARLDLPRHFSVVSVPDGAPRTKPRALNFALQQSSGAYVVIYDAEDVPDPAQLRRALHMLKEPDSHVGCVQARLRIDNSGESWLTRQFAIEYAALFEALLPALERLDFPIPLGGTSNHFPRRVLDEVGGWDPFNVTEDADLGVRLARAGYGVRILASDTMEEAPSRFIAWRNQRTRWLKGWVQTYLVHMRDPARLWTDLGAWRFIGLQVSIGGMLLSPLVHPWFYLLIAADLWNGARLAEGSLWQQSLWWIGLVNLIAGYATAMALGAVAVARHGEWRLAAHAILMPAYWLAISLAAYRALWQFAKAPYLWEKTQHSARPQEATNR